MKITIQKTEYERVEKTVTVNIPDIQTYQFINGIRRAYSLKPVCTTWNRESYNKPEEIFEYKVVMVDPTMYKIEVFNLAVSSLPEVVKNENHQYFKLVNNLLNYPNDDNGCSRIKEQFENDLNTVLQKIQEASGSQENKEDKLDTQDFYDLMQNYRISGIGDQNNVTKHFEAVKQWIRANIVQSKKR